MRSVIRGAAFLLGTVVLVVSCAKVPYTGRIQYNIIPDSLMRTIGKSTYKQMLAGEAV